jgi:hypothetical protein
MHSSNGIDMKIDLHLAEGGWHVVIERDGQRHPLGGIDELIRYLEWLAAAKSRPVRGLR